MDKIQLVDSHCHLDLIDYANDGLNLEQALDEARANRVIHMLSVGVHPKNFTGLCKIADLYPNISISAGLHPNEIIDIEPSAQDLIAMVKSHPKVVALGETGLDYYRSEGDLTWQHVRFENHIEAAIATDMPIIIHMREATADTLYKLRNYQGRVKGVLHCFTEDVDAARKALDLGLYISFSGIVTFKNAVKIQEAAQYVPLDRMLLETDAPYLAPMPYRGKQNYPKYVLHVAEFISTVKNVGLHEVATVTTDNFFSLFKHALR